MRYELTDLRLFQAIADAQSLSGGASATHITASAASYRLKNLEHAMGTPLFVRTARGMELTPAGETLLVHVRELLLGVERMHGEVGRFSAGLKGNIRLLANSSSLNGFIIPSVSRFLLANPDVNIDLEERASQSILAAVAAHEADVGILAGDFQAGGEATGVRSVRYARDELILAVAADHPLAREPEVRFGAALAFDFVCMSRTSSNFLFLRDMAQRAGKGPNVRLHAHSFDAVLSLAEAGVGVALVPRSVAAQALREARVVGVRLAEPWALRELNLIVRADGKLPAFAEAFAQFLLNDPRVVATREGGAVAATAP
ncbi:transcriptional regulator LysR family [Cupriavidus necator N-1]|uniref:Transcriptional regulator LysR family n=1 Tax=Cupriavidus necator (strain ATCC 43291 / DSM 13513 / CCUG 52238 / LMG 8453 / N-1) TaxID=1042878 RepID=F8GMF9_CUPNN|nr:MULTISPECIES: LysR family transcriptional regulator [Cupriavidus]AEI81387.1 transcriptional regulator LysR family [Cupriavidus necator N-1]EYS87734.1 LysR family transcriptional regulator [Cupriavidus sp. SK-4]KAI3596811.1 Transcriptional regulator, LysR family [Cupriavidus necator H850]MDX6009002.1 LysR family transcriptional regulator [Cupriavidus necator]